MQPTHGLHNQLFICIQAILATIGVSIRYGMWGEEGKDIGCDAVLCLTWLGLGALSSSALLRVYRYHNILVKQSGDMWPVMIQVSERRMILANRPQGQIHVKCGIML